MFAIGYDELKKLKRAGETATCPKCGKSHNIILGEEINKDGTKSITKSIGAVKCESKTYLVSVHGKLI